MTLQQELVQQDFANGYELVNGVTMQAEMGARFQIANPWFKRYVDTGEFVELRIDSPRFSAHPDAPVHCTCPHCNEPATKPILGHEQPGSLLKISRQDVPSRGWGEDFWVRIIEREGEFCNGVVDNPLYEARLHQLNEGDQIIFHEDHILSVHAIHNNMIVARMNEKDLRDFVRWVKSQLKE